MPPAPGSSPGTASGASAAAEQLRQRATALRATASELESTPALVLYRRAGDDVWRGPTPTRCLDDLLQMRADLLRAADDLRATARLLVQRADQLDAEARAKAAATGGLGVAS